ncbi:MAG: tRNA lysidine(34) synthetase TilS [Clostridia bacterium]|nr:tRNA lysidine(34) synthetase TilS [Clostridia bacterium]
MNISSTVSEKVRLTIEENEMIKKGDKVLVALSGGADSVCLTHVLYGLSKKMGFSLYAAHLNHGIRGEEADKDEKFSKSFCDSLKVPFLAKTVNAVEIAKEQGITVEEAGRQERYAFFREVCALGGQNVIATAHHRDDAAETVLMRIIRGTGIDGLSGIKYIREDGVIRPLLKVSRDEIEEYCKENSLSYCIDSTNSDNDYTRNKIRNELLPFIRENFNPNITESLMNLSESAKKDSDFLNSYAKRLYIRLGSPMPNRKPVVLHIDSLNMVEDAIMSRLIITAAKEAMGEDFYLERKHIKDILSLKEKETGAMMNFPKGLTVQVKYGWLEFKDEGETEINETSRGIKNYFSTEIEPGNGYKIEGREGAVFVKRVLLSEYKKSAGDILLDEDKLSGKIVLRNRRDGDRMTVFADGREKKLKSIFIDMKIPREKRDDIPLICQGDEVLAIVGGRVSEKYKTNKNSKRAWVIYYGNDRQG